MKTLDYIIMEYTPKEWNSIKNKPEVKNLPVYRRKIQTTYFGIYILIRFNWDGHSRVYQIRERTID